MTVTGPITVVLALLAGALAPWLPLPADVAFAGGQAATPAAAGTPLSLARAVAIALAQSPEVQMAWANVARAQAERRVARAALAPGAGLDVFQQRTWANEDTWSGRPSPEGPAVLGPYTFGQIGFSTSAPLVDLGLWHRWKAARWAETTARARVRSAREALVALVAGQYLQVQRAAEAVAAAESHVTLAGSLATLAADQQAHHVGTRLDTLRAQVQLQNQRQHLIQAQARLQVARAGLIKLLDLPPGTPLALSDPLTAPTAPALTFAAARDAGLAARPELAVLEAREHGARRLRRAAASQRLPTLVVSGAYGTSGLYEQPYIPTGQLYVGMRLPLLEGGRIAAEKAKADSELRQIAEERRACTAQIALEVQVAQTEMAASLSEVEVASQTVALAREEVEHARHRFAAGVSNNIDLVNAQDELARAVDGRIEALFHLNQSRIDLAKAMGQLEPLFQTPGETP